MKTPMQEVYENFNLMSDDEFKSWMLNTDLIEKEKEQIIDVWIDAYTTNMKEPSRSNFLMWANNYYNETFNIEER